MKKNYALLWVARRIKKRLPAIAIMTAANVANAAFAVCFALGSKAVIDSAAAGDKAAFTAACITQGAIIAAILVCLWLYRHLHERLLADLDRDWKKQLLHLLLNGEYPSVSSYHSAELVNRMNSDVKVINDGVLTILPGVASMATRLVMAAGALFVLDREFTLVIIACGTVAVVVTASLRKRLKALHKQVSTMDGRVFGLVQELMEKLLMVQALDVAQEAEARADILLEERYSLQRKRKNVSLLANTLVSVMHYGAGFIALVWGSAKLLAGQVTFGGVTAIIQLVNQLQNPLINLSGIIPRLTAMEAAAERLMELEDITPEKEQTIAAEEIYPNMDSICAEQLQFGYGEERVLCGGGFALEKGSFAVITGASGTGKSTLFKLLLGIYPPAEGRLFFNCGGKTIGIDRSVRRMFSYVPQGNLILSGTIKENILITNPTATDSQLEKALHAACAEEFVSQLEKGLDTLLKENGAGLSEGQLQRIAIARAVAGGAPILLLDECTSALDEATEKEVLRRLKALKGRTIIAITHRPAALELCDAEINIADGVISQTER